MRQVWITRNGGPEVLDVREAPDPVPAAGEVRIQVAAAGVNFADVLIRQGIYPDAPKLPAVIGYEVAGTIDQVGAGVDSACLGSRVLALTPQYGGYSELVTLSAADVVTVPDSLSFEQAATIPVNYLTAWMMLVQQGNIQPGDRVLIHAVAGGVGQAALQICRWKEATVIGTASPSKHERLSSLGVAKCIDYTTEDFESAVMSWSQNKGVDIALDAIGGTSFAKSYRCLAPLGKLFVFGVSSMAPGSRRSLWVIAKSLLTMPKFKSLDLLNSSKGVLGLSMGHLGRKASLRVPLLQEILALVDNGELTPLVDRSFSFDEADNAHQYLQDRRNFGKVLLRP